MPQRLSLTLLAALGAASLAWPGTALAQTAERPIDAPPGSLIFVGGPYGGYWVRQNRPWLRGERQEYEPSTLAIYTVGETPANNCGPTWFEVVNNGPNEAACVGIQRPRRGAVNPR